VTGWNAEAIGRVARVACPRPCVGMEARTSCRPDATPSAGSRAASQAYAHPAYYVLVGTCTFLWARPVGFVRKPPAKAYPPVGTAVPPCPRRAVDMPPGHPAALRFPNL
jgi:hypothetical protein